MLRKTLAMSFIYLITTAHSYAMQKCASDNVLETVRQLSKTQLSRLSPAFHIFFNIEESTYEINGIRTLSEEAKNSRCKAQLTVFLKLRDELEKEREENSSKWELFKSGFPIEPILEGVSYTIIYLIEETDDGRNYYVTLESITE